MHVINQDQWDEGVFRQAIAFKIVLWKTHRFHTSAVVNDYWRAMRACLVLRAEGKRVLLYALTDYQTVLLPDKRWQDYLEIWDEMHAKLPSDHRSKSCRLHRKANRKP